MELIFKPQMEFIFNPQMEFIFNPHMEFILSMQRDSAILIVLPNTNITNVSSRNEATKCRLHIAKESSTWSDEYSNGSSS